MPNLNELGGVFVSVVPSLAGIGKAAADGGKQMADQFSAAFEQHSGQRFAAHGQNIATQLTAGMRTSEAEMQRLTASMEAAYARQERAAQRVAREEAELANMRRSSTMNYAPTAYLMQDKAIADARRDLTTATEAATIAQGKHNEAQAAGVQHTSKLGTAMQGSAMMAGVMGGAVVAAGNMVADAFEGMAHAGEELVKGFIDIGEQWENIERTLTVGTTAMAGDLEGLQDTVRAVGAQTSASLNDIATATAQLAQRTGLRGGPLQDLVTDFADVGKMLGKPADTAAFAASLHALGIPMDQARGWLQQLFNISRQTGVPLNSLVEAVSKNGNAFREFGIAAGPAAALLATFTTHGIDASQSMRGLQAAFKEASKEGKDLPTFLKDTVAQLEQFHETGNKVAEQRVLERAFGPKGAMAFKTAIDDGILSVASLGQALDVPTDGIQQMYDKTKTLSDEMATFRNQLDTALGPIGQALNESLVGGLKGISDWVATHGGELVGWAKAVGDAIFNATEFAAEFLELFGVNTDGFRQHLQDMKKGFDEHAESIKTNTEVIEDLNAAIDKTKDNKLVLKDNSEDVLKDLRKLGVEVTKMPSGELKITADSPENQKRVQDYLKRLTGKDVDVKVVPKPKTPDGKEYKDDPHALFPGSDKKIDVTISPHIDTQFIPDWFKSAWNTFGPGAIAGAFADDTPENRDKYDMHGSGPMGLPGIHDDLPAGPAQTPDAKPDHDRDAKRNATRDYAKAHGDHMPPGTQQWLDDKAAMPPEMGPFYHRATGGSVPGSGTGDHVPILAEPGEFILPKKVVGSNRGLIHAMMAGAKGFHEGGEAGGGSWYGSTPSAPKLPTTENISSHFAKFAGGGEVDGDNPLPWLFSGATGITPPEGGWSSKGEHRNEEWQEKQTQAARSVERQQDHIDDLTDTIDDYKDKLKDITSQLNDPENPLTSEETAKLTKEYQRTLKQLDRSTRDLGEAQDDLKTDKRKQDEAAHTPPGGSGRSDEDDFSKDAGKGLVTGALQELGFPDIFGKAISQWGIVKLGTDIVNHLFGGKDGQGGLLDSLLPKLFPNLFGGGTGGSPNGPGASGSHGETFSYPSLQHVAAAAVPPGLSDAMARSPLFGGGGQGGPAGPTPGAPAVAPSVPAVPGATAVPSPSPAPQVPGASPPTGPVNPFMPPVPVPPGYTAKPGPATDYDPSKASPSSYITGDKSQSWLRQALTSAGLSPSQARGIMAMNAVEGGVDHPESILGFSEAKAVQYGGQGGPQGHFNAFMKQWNDPSRRGPGGSIPGVDANGQVTDPSAYLGWIRDKITVPVSPGDPSLGEYGNRLQNAWNQLDPGTVSDSGSSGGGGGVPSPVTVQSAGYNNTGAAGMPDIAAAAQRVLRNTGQVPLEAMPTQAAGIVATMFPQIKDIGGTRMPGTAAPGTHEIGRTLDVMMPHSPSGEVTGPGDLELGNQIYGYLGQHAPELGISSMIWQNQGHNFLGGRSGAPGSSWSGQSGHMNHIDVQFMPPGYKSTLGDVPNINQMVSPGSPHLGMGASPGPVAGTGASMGSGRGGMGGAVSMGLQGIGALMGALGQDGADAFRVGQHMRDPSPEMQASQARIDAESSAAWNRVNAPKPANSVMNNMMATARAPQPSAPTPPAGNTTNFVMNPQGIMSPPQATQMMQNTYVNANRGASSALSPSLV